MPQRFARLVLFIPVAWLALFFAIPFLIVLAISFSSTTLDVPPYAPLAELKDATLTLRLNLGNYGFLFEDDLYLAAWLGSLRIAGVSTLACLLIGYPMAYAIARTRPDRRSLLLMLVILPFWTSFLIRVYAWIGILQNEGLLNGLLLALGLIEEPVTFLATGFAVQLGITYTYLPFMVLPLYAQLEKLDPALREAAADLGARPAAVFWTVTLPLSLPGVIAGSLLVFVPAVGEVVIPELLGGPDNLMIGRVLWSEFFSNRDWPLASAVAVAMLLVLVLPIMAFQRSRA